jgi:protein SCO1/2
MHSAVAATRQSVARVEEVASHAVSRPLFWVVLVGMLAGWPVVWLLSHPPPPLPPVLGVVPSFRLVDERGRAFGTEELRGRVWAAGFIFTRCATICPAITRKMAVVQRRTKYLADQFHLVSFSVDPEYDTPERLAAYARSYRANPVSWSFLGGPPPAVRDAVVGGLKTAMGREAGPDGQPGEIFHGTHLVLVDREGRMRRIYDVDAPEAIDDLVRDAGQLVNRVR